MQFLLMLHADEAHWETMDHAAKAGAIGAYAAYTRSLADAKVLLGGNRLAASTTATTVRVDADGKSTVLDGPYADTKEQLGGYYLIDVPDLDSALIWAKRCPGASDGTVEIRPIGQSSMS